MVGETGNRKIGTLKRTLIGIMWDRDHYYLRVVKGVYAPDHGFPLDLARALTNAESHWDVPRIFTQVGEQWGVPDPYLQAGCAADINLDLREPLIDYEYVFVLNWNPPLVFISATGKPLYEGALEEYIKRAGRVA